MAEDFAIKIDSVKKQYKLGAIGGGTLKGDLQSWWARVRGKEDPNLMIGQDYTKMGERFMALDGVSFTVKKGEAVGIIGANGAGKSTLLKILSRVTAPTDGDIWIDGRVASMLEVGTGFHPEMTGRENIYMNGAILGMTKKEVDAKIESIIDFSECRQFIDTPVKRYSSGMYVKLAFAVASHLDAEIMIMDEVLAVGDMKFQKKCLGKMGDEAKGGKTVLYVSHNMATIRNLCKRCIVLSHGKVIFDGGVEEAIDVYMGQTKNELVNYINVLELPRTLAQLGKTIKITEFEFLDKNSPVFSTQEKMLFRINVCSFEEIDDYRIRLEIKYADGSVVGMCESNNIGTMHMNETRNLVLMFDVKNLAEGTYSFRLSIFSLDLMGVHSGLDDIPQNIYFEIVDTVSNRTGWLRQYWGSVRFDQLEVNN